MPQYFVPSADELAGSGESRKPLPGNEDYRAKILSIDLVSKPNYDGKIVDVFSVKFDVLSFADGAKLEDIDGNAVDSRWAWKDIDPTKMGFKQDGTASFARQFFLAANGVSDLSAKVPQGNTDDLIGREVVLSMVVYNGKDGSQRNRVIAIKTPSRRRGSPAVESKQTPKVESTAQETDFDATDPAYLAAVDALVNS